MAVGHMDVSQMRPSVIRRARRSDTDPALSASSDEVKTGRRIHVGCRPSSDVPLNERCRFGTREVAMDCGNIS